MNPIYLTPKQLRQAASIQERIQSLQKQLRQLLGGSPAPVTASRTPRKRKMSAVGRKRLSELAKARWAKAKKAGKTRL